LKEIFDEELYYHKSLTRESRLLFDETEERENLIGSLNSTIKSVRDELRSKLLQFLREDALYGLGELRDHYLSAIGQNRTSNEEHSNTSYRNVWSNANTGTRRRFRREIRMFKKNAQAHKRVIT
jgi:hypothetical protein